MAKGTNVAKPPAPGATAKANGKAAEKAIRVLKGDAKAGVRAHPSYDQPGKFYAVEAGTRRRVFSGYHSAQEIAAECKKRGWTFLGVVPVKQSGAADRSYNMEATAAAIKAFGNSREAKKG